MSDKRCPKCGNTYPATPEYFHRRKGDLLNSWCKTCQTALIVAIQRRHREEARQRHERAIAVAAQAQVLVAANGRAYAVLDFVTSHWGHAA